MAEPDHLNEVQKRFDRIATIFHESIGKIQAAGNTAVIEHHNSIQPRVSQDPLIPATNDSMIEQVPEFVDEIVQNATEFMTHADHLPQPVEQLDFDQQIQQLEARNRTIGEEIREALRDSEELLDTLKQSFAEIAPAQVTIGR